VATAAAPDTTPGWGWGTFILPHLEQGNVFNQLNLGQPLQTQAGVGTFLKVFVCPSDNPPTSSFPLTDAGGAIVCLAGPSSYAATVGDDAVEVDAVTGNGVFYRNSRVRVTDITDGASTTTLLGDRAWSDTKGVWAGAPNGALTRAGPTNPWQSTTAPPPALILVHNNWINIKTDADGGLDDFSSKHTDGVNILFADGSVRFIHSIVTDGPKRLAFWAMGTRGGGEVVDGLD
jgi:prepilin-type processing-associated H-X9-DG protein